MATKKKAVEIKEPDKKYVVLYNESGNYNCEGSKILTGKAAASREAREWLKDYGAEVYIAEIVGRVISKTATIDTPVIEV